jgi:hypothetical protein
MRVPRVLQTSENPRIAPTPTLDVICEGGAYEMGCAQGAAVRGKILHVLGALRDLEVFQLARPRWMPFDAFRRLAEHKIGGLWKDLRRDSPDAADRLDGLAAGSGVPRRSVWLLNALEPLVARVEDKTVVPPLAACSAVAVRGARSATGEPIIARNFDYLPLVQPCYIVRESRPRGASRSLDFTIASLGGAVDGMNEHGLCVTYDYAYVRDSASCSGTISMVISSVLERCRNVGEAEVLLRARPRWGGGLLMLADADGDIASIELSSTRSAIRRPRAGEDFLFHTNRFQTVAMRQVEVDSRSVFCGRRAPRALRGCRVLGSSESRDRRFGELLAGDAPLDEDDLQAVLADHGSSEGGGESTICTHGSYWHTTASLQLFPRSRRIRIAYDTACNARYEEFAL